MKICDCEFLILQHCNIINPRSECAARVTVVVPCVCMCVRSNRLPHTMESQKRGTNGFIAIRERIKKKVF